MSRMADETIVELDVIDPRPPADAAAAERTLLA